MSTLLTAEKSIDIKFAVGELSLTIGLVLLSFGIRWCFFVGFALFMASTLFSLRRDRRPLNPFIWIPLWLGCAIFLAWLSALGTEPMPWAALVGVWIGLSAEEFNSWRQSRSPNAAA